MVAVKKKTVRRDTVRSCALVSATVGAGVERGRRAYQQKRPGQPVVLAVQLAQEVAHDTCDDQTRDKLRGADGVEGEDWVVRRFDAVLAVHRGRQAAANTLKAFGRRLYQRRDDQSRGLRWFKERDMGAAWRVMWARGRGCAGGGG